MSDRVAGVFILVHKENRELARPHCKGYPPFNTFWLDATKVVHINPLTPPPIQRSEWSEYENFNVVTLDDGKAICLIDSTDELLALCNEAKANADVMVKIMGDT